MSFSKFKFCDLVDYIQPTKYQVKTKESIQEKGNISVLTPGKSFVLGFTNESEGIFYASKENPIILFDDFTCNSQWVDFNFKVRSSACKILILKDNVKNITSLRFLFHLMKKIKVNIDESEHQRQWISRYSQIEVKIPSIAVQNKILTSLDTIAELKAELKAELRARDKQNKYYQEHLLSEESLSGKLWGFKEEIIKYVKLSEVFEIQRGKRITKEWMKFHPGKYPVYSAKITGDLVMGYIDQYLFDGEYLLISSYGEAGNVSYVKNKFWAIDSATLLKNKNSNRFNIKFYMHYLNLVAKNYVNTAATPPSLTPNVIANILVPLPSLKIQNKIVAIMDKLESLINSVNGDIPVEISTREDQYKYYSELLLSY